MMLTIKSAIIILSLAVTATQIEAQNYYGQRNNSQPGNRSRLVTPYFGARAGAYQQPQSSYQLSPYLNYQVPGLRTSTLPPVSGPVERYSEIEYGEIVKMTIDAARRNSPSISTGGTRESIVDETTTSLSGAAAYQPVATAVSDVLNRGILLLPTGEELRLRGVILPSTTDRNEVSRIYAREGVQMLRNLTQGKEVYVILDDPLRDGDGRLLGSVILADGTEINQKMLEMGYGSLKTDDFATGVDYSDLQSSQQSAQEKRLGVWSKGY